MTNAALRVLAEALFMTPAAPRDGWEHFLTSMGDDRRSVFMYDRPNGDSLRVELVAGRVDRIELLWA